MSLRETIGQAVQAGIAAIGDIAEQVIYTSMATPSYDPAAGSITAPSATYSDVPIVFTNYRRQEIDGEAIRLNDQKAIVAQLDLTPVPTLNDTIMKADGSVWSVISVLTDPAGATWILQVRRP